MSMPPRGLPGQVRNGHTPHEFPCWQFVGFGSRSRLASQRGIVLPSGGIQGVALPSLDCRTLAPVSKATRPNRSSSRERLVASVGRRTSGHASPLASPTGRKIRPTLSGPGSSGVVYVYAAVRPSLSRNVGAYGSYIGISCERSPYITTA